jgi:transposase InsO family protein
MGISRKKKPKKKRKAVRRTAAFPFEFRLKVVRLHLEDGYPATLIAEQFGISKSTVGRWSRNYRAEGEQGLFAKERKPVGPKVQPVVTNKIVALKKENPGYGTRRITDILKRFFLIRTCPSTVQRTLADQGLNTPVKKKPKKNPSKPRFFERAKPNQMWQSDILTFRLSGKNAYLIGYLDDYSRYITSLGFYRSQTAENVIETYRRAVGEYGVPKEMLTDNGRQYTNWRGTTRFEKELSKDRVKHIRSRPHHPMTLGKIERFWKSILTEFLQRAQFTSYEDATERIAFWIKYYNYKRPHQGIGGLCPADRFFEIETALKRTLEQGVEENALEMALRGKPRDPFYMVGRMGDQSVVIRAEKGKVKMLVDDNNELVYDAGKDRNNETHPPCIRSEGKDHRRIVRVDTAKEHDPNLQRDVHQLDIIGSMAEPGHGGDAQSAVPQAAGSVQGIESKAGATDRQEVVQQQSCQTGKTPSDDPAKSELKMDISHGTQETERQGHAASPADHAGTLRPDDRFRSGQTTGGIP